MAPAHQDRHVTSYNILVVGGSMISSLLLGYAQGIISSTLGQPSWYRQLNLVSDPTQPGYSHTSTIEGAANGVFFGFAFFGTLAAGLIMNWQGRIRAFQFSACWHIVGAAICAGTVDQAMFLVGRSVTGVGTGMSLVIGPIYFAEVAPPLSRGIMAGMHGAALNNGYMLAAWVGFGASFASATSTFGFRFPLAIPILIAGAFLTATIFMPESPRWLTSRGRHEEALIVLTRLHGGATNEFARREQQEIRKQVAAEEEALAGRSAFAVLLTNRTYLRRLAVATLVVAGAVNTGVLVINNYAVLIYTSLGLSSTIALLLAAVWSTLAMITNYIGAIISDKVGRRRLLLIGNTGCTLCVILFTATYAEFSKTGKKSYAKAAVFFDFLFILFYGIGVDPQSFVVAAEVFPLHLRATGSSIAVAMYYVTSTLWTELAPTAFDSIGWRYYTIFVAITTVQIGLMYLYLPETANVPLEEIDEVFGGRAATHLNDFDPDNETSSPAEPEAGDDSEKAASEVKLERKDEPKV